MPSGILHDAFVCRLKPREQEGLWIIARSFGENFLDCLDSYTTRFLAAFVAAHAISHNGQSALAREFLVVGGFPISTLIFVVFSLAANVTHARQLNSRPYSHHTSRAAFEQVKTRFPVR
jgi:hypothetical protein